MDYKAQIGDIILKNSNHTGAKVVKYFMRSPTIWHDLYRMITRKIEKVEYYHVSMIYSSNISGVLIVEQQKEVEINAWNPTDRQIIFRKKDLTMEEEENLIKIVKKERGQGYDILNCFGKFLTWITGIKFFARYIQWPKAEICVNRVVRFYKEATGENFGAKTHSELTTQDIYKFMINNKNYEVVYKKD